MIDVTSLQPWFEREQHASDTVGSALTARLASLLNRAPAEWPMDTPIPPEWYVQLFAPLAPQASLAADGHPPKGDLLPPVSLPRRMFAGRRVEFWGDLRIGDMVSRRSRVTSITPKEGSGGDMCFVTLRHELDTSRGLALVEEQDVVYRAAAAGPATAATPARRHDPALERPQPAFSKTLLPDTSMLFRYSAITFNAHRIHYDQSYTKDTEGYPDLVVNGGLSALLLWDFVRASLDCSIRRSATRNLKPLFVNRALTIHVSQRQEGGTVHAWINDDTGAQALQATLEVA